MKIHNLSILQERNNGNNYANKLRFCFYLIFEINKKGQVFQKEDKMLPYFLTHQ